VWHRTRFTLTAAQAASAATLALGAIDQVDETWLNGHAVGNTFGYGTERTYSVAAGTLQAGDNILVVNVLSTDGGGGLLGDHAKRALRLSGAESIALDGPWQYRIALSAVGNPPRAPWESVGGLGTLYNAMIAPLGSYGIRGALWYQGESNTGEAETYRTLLAGLIADWRHQFGTELPFLVVQLPNFGPPPSTPGESGWAEVREAQRQVVANDPHAGLAVTIDIGDARNLHPTNKQDVGRRLARAARRVIYGDSISPSGPSALAAVRDGNQIAVEFRDVDRGLVAYSHDSPIDFELCSDSPGTCRFVDSGIDGTRVLLSIPYGTSPTRVRYCWADSPVCTLFDLSSLPAGPFELRIRQ
jgi:sialate O-acetylesterase